MTPRRARAEGWPSAGGGERARGEKDKCHDDNDGGAEAEAVATTGLCENIIKQHRSYFYFAPANIVVGLSVLAFGNIITTVSIARPCVRQLRIRVLNRKLVESRFFYPLAFVRHRRLCLRNDGTPRRCCRTSARGDGTRRSLCTRCRRRQPVRSV